MSLLNIQSLSHGFGQLQAITDFNLTLEANEIVGIIGPNGAGKTTLFNLITGFYVAQKGQIFLNQTSLIGLASHIIAHKGLARTFQNIRLFKRLSVLDNLRCVIADRYSLSAALCQSHLAQQKENDILEHAWHLLQLFKLEKHAQQRAETLPYGLQRRLEIARAIATEPKVLLLDEPACGMNPNECASLHDLIVELKKLFSVAILLIDHQMPFVMSLCPKIMVLNFGKIIATGSPDFIRSHPEVIQSYLGGSC